MKSYQNWAKKEHSLKQRSILLFFAGILFVLLLPYLLTRWSANLDNALQLPTFSYGAANIIPGLLLVIGGFALALWSIYVQITLGRGTPVPVMPTQTLIIKPPFSYCRNPMTLGTLIGYGGIGVMLGSWSALGFVLLFGLLLLFYLKLVEEKELVARFGESYLEYKRTTPFIIPRLTRR